MSTKASITIKGRNPDVLTCIANLSNDEVFTPPELANRMLDDLASAWALSNGGKSIWSDRTIRFLDPCAKSGVFLREITKRLLEGLKEEIPDLQQRVDHILSKQVFGIAITRLTSLLARRSLYCSKEADSKHSIAKALKSASGNIWFKRTEHSWDGTKCQYCDAPKAHLDRENTAENYAYAFLHTDNISNHLTSIFGTDMQFDVIIGNPPYQMKGGAGGTSDSSIYHLFVEQAIKLQPRYLSMVIPSRWMAGGRGMDEFRREMLNSRKVRFLADYLDSSEAFPGVQIKGGICYFLWESGFSGPCNVKVISGGAESSYPARDLGEFDVLVRNPLAVEILRKVLSKSEPTMDAIVSNREPFKLESNFDGHRPKPKEGDIELYRITPRERRVDWVPRSLITKNSEWIDSWKLFVPKAYGAGEAVPHQILGVPIIAHPPSVCTGSYLAIPAKNEAAVKSLNSYYQTKFFRFLVSLRKITQDAFSHMYAWVPQQKWDHIWTDKELYKKYGLTQDQIKYIDSVIKEMPASSSDE